MITFQGLIYSVRGPILMDLADFAQSNSLSNISLIFPSSAVGLVLGSVACEFPKSITLIIILLYLWIKPFIGRFLHDSPRAPRLLVPSYSISLVLGSLAAMAVALFPGSVVLICVAFMLQGFALGPLKDGKARLRSPVCHSLKEP